MHIKRNKVNSGQKKSTMKGRGFQEPLNQHSVNNTVINSQNMELSLYSHSHNNLEDIMCQLATTEEEKWMKEENKEEGQR